MFRAVFCLIGGSTQQDKCLAYFQPLAAYPHATDPKVLHDKDSQLDSGSAFS